MAWSNWGCPECSTRLWVVCDDGEGQMVYQCLKCGFEREVESPFACISYD